MRLVLNWSGEEVRNENPPFQNSDVYDFSGHPESICDAGVRLHRVFSGGAGQ